MHLFQDPRFLAGVATFLICLVALFIGVAILGKTGRKVSWWLSLVSLVILTSGGIVFMVCEAIIEQRSETGAPYFSRSLEKAMIGSAIAIGLGIILFIAGHLGAGLRTARMAKRVAQLELLRSTMTAEIERRKNGNTAV